MTTPQHNSAPASPIPSHLAVVTGGLGVVLGIAALVLLLCVITVEEFPTAPMNFAAIAAATCGAVAWVTKLAKWTIEHRQTCFEANRQASVADLSDALKRVHKEVEKLKAQLQRAEVARVSAAIFEQEQPTRFGVINGGGNGLG